MVRTPVAVVLLGLALPLLSIGAARPAPTTVTVDLTDAGRRGEFRPDQALGAGIDGAQAGDIDRLLTKHNIAAMRSAGLTSLTYRLRTELGIEAWHWNDRGSWSDPAHEQGYWTSSDALGPPIQLSHGYRLPRRGDTIDNANNVDYSRLTDGDPATFWKSNPYLDRRFTGDPAPHPQWLVARLEAPAPIDAMRIDWAEPYATAYRVQYWTGAEEYDPAGRWADFPQGVVENGHGGSALLRLSQKPITARFVRVLMTKGSGTAPAGSTDVRDRLGYAVGEIAIGVLTPAGELRDLVRHAASHTAQTFTHVSSTDPWHRAVDRDPDLEQAGLDRIFASGLGNGRPIMVPVGVLFDTPDNAAAEIRYLKRRGYPLDKVELGEEPDGQYGEAADYGALYLETVDRLRGEAPELVYGGPSLQSALTDTWMNPDPDTSWNSHFIGYLKRRGRLSDLGFFSFEHYPFDDICGDIHARLIEQNHLMDRLMARLAAEGVPREIPWLISEYGFSAFSGRAMSEMPSALLMANIVGQFLTEGGAGAYMFGYGPNVPVNQHQPCAGYGNMMLFMADPDGQAAQPMPALYTAQMLTRDWLAPGDAPHRLYLAAAKGDLGEAVKAYAVRRPDGRLGVLIINRSPTRDAEVSLEMRTPRRGAHPLHGRADVWTYGPAQYTWLDKGPDSRPGRDLPPAHAVLSRGDWRVVVPADSLAVVAG